MKLSLSHATLLMLLLAFFQPSTLNSQLTFAQGFGVASPPVTPKPGEGGTNRVLQFDGNGSYVELLLIFSDLQASSRWIVYRYENR